MRYLLAFLVSAVILFFVANAASAQTSNSHSFTLSAQTISGSAAGRFSGLSETFTLGGQSYTMTALFTHGSGIQARFQTEAMARAWAAANLTVDPGISGQSSFSSNQMIVWQALFDRNVWAVQYQAYAGRFVANTDYTITITAPTTTTPTTDASLSALTLSAGTLSPAFDEATLTYTADVANSVTSVNVTATTTRSGATLTINGSTATSGSASAVALSVGSNTITIVVTASDGTTQRTYKVAVTRAMPAPPTGFKLAAGDKSITATWNTASGSAVYDLELRDSTLANALQSPTGVAATSYTFSGLTPTTEYAARLRYRLVSSGRTIRTSAWTTYSRITTKADAAKDASLSALTLSAGSLSPAFDKARLTYTADVSNSATSVNVTATTTQSGATLTVNGSTATSAVARGVALNVGANTITVVVTASDGTTRRTYTVTVTRAAPDPRLADASLSALTLSAGSLSPAFDKATFGYTADVANDVTSVGVTATTTQSGSTLTVNGSTATSAVARAASLNVGANTITIVVTAPNGVTKRTYTVTVTRAAPPPEPESNEARATDYAYRVPVDLNNTTGADLSGEWIPVRIPVDRLRDGSYIKNTVLVTDSDARRVPGFAQDNRALATHTTWWVNPPRFVDNSEITMYFYVGGEPDDAVTGFPLDSRLGVSVAHGTDQLITSGLNIEVDADLTGTGDGWLVHKADAYSLGVQGGMLTGQVSTEAQSTASASTSLAPNSGSATGSGSSWQRRGGCSTLQACVDTSGSDYLELNTNAGRTLRFGFTDFARANFVRTTNVRGCLSYKLADGRIGEARSIYFEIRTSAGSQLSGSRHNSLTRTSYATICTPAYTRSRSLAQLNDIEARISPGSESGNTLSINRVWLSVTYSFSTTVAGDPIQVTASIPSGRNSLGLRHVGTELRLTNDADVLARATVPSALTVSGTSPIQIGTDGIRGDVYGVKILASSTERLSLDFSPSSIRETATAELGGETWGGEITDNSPSAATVTYAIKRSLSGLTRERRGIEILDQSSMPAVTAGSTTQRPPAIFGRETDPSSFIDDTPENEESIGSVVVGALFEASENSLLGNTANGILLAILIGQAIIALTSRALKALIVKASIGGGVVMFIVLLGMMPWGVFIVYVIWAVSFAVLAGRLGDRQ